MKHNNNKHDDKTKPGKSVLSRNIVKIYFRVAYLIAAIITISAASYAWFSQNSKVSQTATEIVSDNAQLKIGSFAVIFASKTDENNNVTEAEIKTSDITLNEYDSVFGKNNDTPVYIRVELIGENDVSGNNMTFSSVFTREDVNNSYITTDSGLHPLKQDGTSDKDKMAEYLSNIIQVQWLDDSELDNILTGSGDEKKRALDFYNAAQNKTWSEPVSFYDSIPIANGRNTNLDGIKKNATLNLDNIKVNTSKDGKSVFFIKIDYSWPLVEAYVNMEYGNTVRRLDKAISTQDFEGDIKRISFDVK